MPWALPCADHAEASRARCGQHRTISHQDPRPAYGTSLRHASQVMPFRRAVWSSDSPRLVLHLQKLFEQSVFGRRWTTPHSHSQIQTCISGEKPRAKALQRANPLPSGQYALCVSNQRTWSACLKLPPPPPYRRLPPRYSVLNSLSAEIYMIPHHMRPGAGGKTFTQIKFP
jgi:hypothetical protein